MFVHQGGYTVKKVSGLLLVGCSALALAGCGPSDIASPGTGGNVVVNNPAPTPSPSPTPTPTPTGVVAASGCPGISASTQLKDAGVLSGPTGSYRVCTIPAVIDRSITLTKQAGLVYQLDGRVDVGCDGGFAAPTSGSPFATSTVGCPSANLTADTNVTLTIDPGVIVIAAPGATWLGVNRGNKINAVGTASQPIIFTSRDNLLGQTTDTSQGLWGGVVLMGRAPVTDCTTGTTASGNCERQTEGSTNPARFGGGDNAYSAGRMSYVQIRYSGFILSNNIELQSLTGEGVGTGAQMNVQYALMIQRDGLGDALFEIDSNGNEGDTPRTKLNVANFTAIQKQTSSNNESNDQAASLFRGNSDTTLINGIIATPNNECIRMNGSGSTPATLNAYSVVMTCNATKFIGTGAYSASQVSGFFNVTGRNNDDGFTSTLNGYTNGTNETGVQATDPKTISAFFDTTTWIGAVRNASDTWYAGWTCNSTFANFGTGNSGNCTSLPTT